MRKITGSHSTGKVYHIMSWHNVLKYKPHALPEQAESNIGFLRFILLPLRSLGVSAITED